jgi:hypothetical protein
MEYGLGLLDLLCYTRQWIHTVNSCCFEVAMYENTQCRSTLLGVTSHLALDRMTAPYQLRCVCADATETVGVGAVGCWQGLHFL